MEHDEDAEVHNDEPDLAGVAGLFREVGVLRGIEHGYLPAHERILPAGIGYGDANVVSSRVEGAAGVHAPCIDIDLPCRLVESHTPGHFHLYVDSLVSWERYLRLLKALHECGIIEDGYYNASLQRGCTVLRLPGVPKPPA